MTSNDDEEWMIMEIARKDAPDVKFEGRCLWRVSSLDEHRQGDRHKDRWTELAIYELRSGVWVACSIGCSDKPGEIDVGDAAALKAMTPQETREAAMAFFGWSWLAKALARKAGWDVVEVFE